jgi:hypothetical protein
MHSGGLGLVVWQRAGAEEGSTRAYSIPNHPRRDAATGIPPTTDFVSFSVPAYLLRWPIFSGQWFCISRTAQLVCYFEHIGGDHPVLIVQESVV